LSLASFFNDMRSALDAAAPSDRPSPRTVVLSPGFGHPSYFEHSYLAAHLGYHLAEIGDLVVRHDRVWLRALSGLEPVDVLLRRVDGDAVDPLESSTERWACPGSPAAPAVAASVSPTRSAPAWPARWRCCRSPQRSLPRSARSCCCPRCARCGAVSRWRARKRSATCGGS